MAFLTCLFAPEIASFLGLWPLVLTRPRGNVLVLDCPLAQNKGEKFLESEKKTHADLQQNILFTFKMHALFIVFHIISVF